MKRQIIRQNTMKIGVAMLLLSASAFVQSCKGDKGSKGNPGTPGTTGETGATGAQGTPGPTMQVGSSGMTISGFSRGGTSTGQLIISATRPSAGWTCSVWGSDGAATQTSTCTYTSSIPGTEPLCVVSCVSTDSYNTISSVCINPAANLYQAVAPITVSSTACP